MKINKLKVKTHKLEVVWADDVVAEIIALAHSNGWEVDREDVESTIYADPDWSWGDAEYTLLSSKVFVQEVLDAIDSDATVRGRTYSFDYKFDLVALIG